MDYYLKYLKYKNKYIKLQKQSKLQKQFGGDWTCNKCTFINRDDQLECNICGIQKPRVAGIIGIEQRRETEEKNKEIDAQNEINMGNSTDKVTQKGTIRKEWKGR